jgi:hypothetical protein
MLKESFDLQQGQIIEQVPKPQAEGKLKLKPKSGLADFSVLPCRFVWSSKFSAASALRTEHRILYNS